MRSWRTAALCAAISAEESWVVALPFTSQKGSFLGAGLGVLCAVCAIRPLLLKTENIVVDKKCMVVPLAFFKCYLAFFRGEGYFNGNVNQIKKFDPYETQSIFYTNPS